MRSPYDGDVDAWVWWLIAAAVLGLAEIVSVSLVFAMLAGGALAAAVVDILGGGLPLQFAAFIVVSVALLGALRPIARKHLYQPPETRTGVAALIGAKALVLERVDAHNGLVKINGEVWSARAYDGESVLEPGQTVDVVQIEGSYALVL
ncbi:hypothetical protein TH66_16460 [Carbonactinospora thermoautotrophica]|uniref:NfeD-like C-terminal domain-containing protein n=1 Tax=Carbonactinospora thermoautotrophica TaxID=1469144 RepID=A0A132MRC4_9ACTN|nr:hypothetical protein TH66_16460 [Carbonactinospora thermoautotrophica]KWX01547.1 hypothetical protein LI90_2579 [Carbonactinospora thermoautotrophica]KWX09803.1 hypothetical protein TR74_07425 [Carbonactinospora thermoautotrophica]